MMKSFANPFAKRSAEEEKSKPQYEATTRARPKLGAAHLQQSGAPILSPSSLQTFKPTEHFTPLRLPINEIFNDIKDQPWFRHLRPIQNNPALPGAEE